MKSKYPELDKWFPPRGPCAFCGGPDKRHRLWDAILSSKVSDQDLAAWYDLPLAAVKAVRRIRPYKKK